MAVLLLLLLAGCSRFQRGAASNAIAVGADSWLDQQVSALQLAPGESAYQLEERNRGSFALRMHSAAAATRSIDAQYYLWHNDLTGRLLAAELLQAAARGVRVRVLIDDTAGRETDRQLAALDSHPLIEIRLFNPWHTRNFVLGNVLEFLVRAGRPNYRMHNKLWLVDGRLALVGGRNIGDEYFGASADFNFTDLGVLLLGAVVGDCERNFDLYWNSAMVTPVRSLRPRDPPLERLGESLQQFRARTLAEPFALAVLGPEGPRAAGLAPAFADLLRGHEVQFVSDEPDKVDQREAGMRLLPALRGMLARAQQELVLVSPYFVPRRSGVEVLATMRQRGVVVHVLTNSLAATDVPAVHGGYSKRRKALLRTGVNLYELKPDPHRPVQVGQAARGDRSERGGGSSGASLHSKGVVVDGHLAFVGSLNLDPRSAKINTENGVFIDDERFAGKVRSHWVSASDPRNSYSVRLTAKGLTWTHREGEQELVLTHEPKVQLKAGLLAWLFRWLPLEGQL